LLEAAGNIVPSLSLYRIGEYSIDLATRAIRRGDVPVDVEAKVFDLIGLLLSHHGRALSKREINDTLWGQRPVTDAALSQLLSKARRALGDDGESQHVIRTVHGRGLQWAAPVLIAGAEKIDAATDPQPIPSPAAIASPARSRLVAGGIRRVAADRGGIVDPAFSTQRSGRPHPFAHRGAADHRQDR